MLKEYCSPDISPRTIKICQSSPTLNFRGLTVKQAFTEIKNPAFLMPGSLIGKHN